MLRSQFRVPIVPAVSVLRERAPVRQDDRRISTIARLSDLPETLAEARARPIVDPNGINEPTREPLMVLRV